MGVPQTPVARMDRSMPHGTVHGERTPDDRYAGVHFFQNGLPFNAQGVLIPDHPHVNGDPKLRAKADAMLKKASKKKASAPGDVADDPEAEEITDEDEESEDQKDGPPNLEAWARGEEKLEWQKVSDAIAARFKKRIANKNEALEFLVEQKVISLAELSREHKKLLGV